MGNNGGCGCTCTVLYCMYCCPPAAVLMSYCFSPAVLHSLTTTFPALLLRAERRERHRQNYMHVTIHTAQASSHQPPTVPCSQHLPLNHPMRPWWPRDPPLGGRGCLMSCPSATQCCHCVLCCCCLARMHPPFSTTNVLKPISVLPPSLFLPPYPSLCRPGQTPSSQN